MSEQNSSAVGTAFPEKTFAGSTHRHRGAVVITGLTTSLILIVLFALTMAYPNLPDIDAISYNPKMPLRIYTADHVLIGEFGEERRNVVRFQEIPDVMKKAVLAIEDDRFYEHGGVDILNRTGGFA
jgi:penicillin-binding protein 1A